jgi:hypothetical protein
LYPRDITDEAELLPALNGMLEWPCEKLLQQNTADTCNEPGNDNLTNAMLCSPTNRIFSLTAFVCVCVCARARLRTVDQTVSNIARWQNGPFCKCCNH